MSLMSFLAVLAFGFVVPAAEAASVLMSRSNSSSPAGAVYFISNDPASNAVLTSSIGSNGKLTFGQAVPTHGKGSHGDDGTNNAGTDPLYSANSVVVNAPSRLLAAVNAGSNTVSLFEINANNPSNLTMIGFPASSNGDFPVSLVFNKAGNKLCVLNGGGNGAIACFNVDKAQGLQHRPESVRALALNQTTPSSGPAGSASTIAFSEDETQLVVAVKGLPSKQGYFMIWSISGDGTLSSNSTTIYTPGKDGSLPFSLTPIPGKNAYLAADAAYGANIFELSGTKNASAVKFDVPQHGAICWSTYSSKTKNFYVADAMTNVITEIHLDGNLRPSTVKQYPTIANASTHDLTVATIGGKDYLYASIVTATSVRVMRLDGPGSVHAIQTLDLSSPARKDGARLAPAYMSGLASYVKP
ncbi:hypothetical protein OF83DRAFT_1177135 [Amylostereum chailletii]|nr:hypothetical protein OF83DRAFT_1177135 [Amylostereum chailletii]